MQRLRKRRIRRRDTPTKKPEGHQDVPPKIQPVYGWASQNNMRSKLRMGQIFKRSPCLKRTIILFRCMRATYI